ncbi:MAG: membrane protein insertion efficiency factor YidD [Actinomycetota bacterium]|nr:membrane protein insertion efficiency factor YidD [Actinomycetota bacterium]
MKRALASLRATLVAVFLAPIRLYQRFISPALPRRCKYEPTCSAYAVDAVRELGVARGSILAGWRLLRCNPWSHGGWDPVSERTLFRADEDETVTETHKHEAHA